MKKWIFFSVVILFACNSAKELALPGTFFYEDEVERREADGKVFKKSVQVTVGKQLELKKDNTGKFYVVYGPGDKVIFKIEVARLLQEPLTDSELLYSLVFETSNPVKSFEKENENLRDIKAVYGYHAFDPKSGYYPLDKGKIALQVDKRRQKIIIKVELPDEYGKMLNGEYTIDLQTLKS